MSKNVYKIHEEANVIDDHLLDIIGASFSFDHVKGLSEWLKNSVDAYIRNGVADKDQYVYFRFADGKNGNASIECIDFNGMSEADIEKALKRWGDPQASKRGLKLKTFGGHGNGGKFYMRQMFSVSHFVTYKDGKLSAFGFNENKKYGFAEGFKSKPLSPKEALAYAGLEKTYFPSSALSSVLNGDTGFTVVRGVGPVNMPNMPKVGFIINHLISHPQSQRILSRIPSKVIYNEKIYMDRLKTDELKPLPGFENIEPITVPAKLVYETHNDRVEVEMADEKYPQGVLTLYTSEHPLAKNGKYGELNRIDVLGEIGVIASYKIHELGGITLPKAEFIYGELQCPILEKPGNDDCVQNDRAKLTENPTTKALLDWVNIQVIELCKKISDKERQEREDKLKDVSSSLNNYLNQWKDRFMSKILSDILVGKGPNKGHGTGGDDGGEGGSGTGGEPGEYVPGDGDPIQKPGSGGGDGPGDGPNAGGTGDEDSKGGGDKPKKSKRSPRVLLSDQDPDPLSPTGESLNLSPRQPAVYQRPVDTTEGIYWINTSAPLAKSILDRYDQNDARWRDYLFQRYVDIFVREALDVLQNNDPGEFNAPNVEQKINEVVTRIHQAAATELSSFLFEDTFTVE